MTDAQPRHYEPGRPPAALLARVRRTRPIVMLSSNESALGPSPLARHAYAAAADELHVYPETSSALLRERIAEVHAVHPDEVCVGAGSTDLIYQLVQGQLVHGSAGPGTVLAPAYTFVAYALAARQAGLAYVEVPGVGFEPDLDALAAAIDPTTQLVCIANPNNPTGAFVERAALTRFLARVPAHVPVVLDEAYAELVDAPGGAFGVQLRAAHPNLVVLRTLSKAYGLAALRVGYALASRERVRRLEQRRPPFSVSAPAQAAALAALGDHAHLASSVRLVHEGRPSLTAALEARGFGVHASQGNFVCVEVGPSAPRLWRELLAAGFVVRPLEPYGLSRHLRITIGTPEQHEGLLAALDGLAAQRDDDER